MPTIDEVFDYVQNKHPALILDKNDGVTYTNMYLEVPYLTQEDIQQNHVFFMKSATTTPANDPQTVTIKTMDGITVDVTYDLPVVSDHVYAFGFDVNGNVNILGFHDTAMAAQVHEMYTGKYSRIIGAISEDDGDTGLSLSGYGQKLTVKDLIATATMNTQTLTADTVDVTKIIIPALDVNNPSVIYGGDNSGLVTFNALDLSIDSKIEDAINEKIKIDSRTPEAYEVDTGEALANGVIYFQVSSDN